MSSNTKQELEELEELNVEELEETTDNNTSQTDDVNNIISVDQEEIINVEDEEELLREEFIVKAELEEKTELEVKAELEEKTEKAEKAELEEKTEKAEKADKHTINDLFIINLEEKEKRWSIMTNRLKEEKCKKTFHRYMGVDGSKLNMSEIRNDVSKRSGKYFITHEMYGKAKSHYLLWKSILEKNTHLKNKTKNWFIILEDDAIIPTQFNKYLTNLEEFLNTMSPKTIKNTEMFNLSPIGDYGGKRDFHQNIMAFLTKIGSHMMHKHKFNNQKIETQSIDDMEWSVLNSNFPLCTHAYLVNLKQIKNLIKIIDETQIYFHIDWQLNFENVNINTITPIAIQRGGYDDSTSSTTSNPTMPIQLLTMLNKKLACDLGKPLFNIMGIYKINILIFVYILLMLVWQLLDIPNRLNNFFLNINTKSNTNTNSNTNSNNDVIHGSI